MAVIIDKVFDERILRQASVMSWLDQIGDEVIENAIAVYDSQALGFETPPYYYRESFGMEVNITRDGFELIVYNTDPTMMMVEYGAHAGGTTYTLGYAPLRSSVEG